MSLQSESKASHPSLLRKGCTLPLPPPHEPQADFLSGTKLGSLSGPQTLVLYARLGSTTRTFYLPFQPLGRIMVIDLLKRLEIKSPFIQHHF